MKTRSSSKPKIETTKKSQEEPTPEVKPKVSTKRSRTQVKKEEKEEKIKEGKEEALQCGICLDEVKIRGKLNACEHPFCFPCIEQWSKTANTCPFCKSRFTSLDQVDCSEPKKKPKKIKVKHADQHYEWEGPSSYLEFEDSPLMNAFSSHFQQFLQATIQARAFGLLNPYEGFFSDDDSDFDSDDSDDDNLLDEDDNDLPILPMPMNPLTFFQNFLQVGMNAAQNQNQTPFQNSSDAPIDLTQESDQEEDDDDDEDDEDSIPGDSQDLPQLVDTDSD